MSIMEKKGDECLLLRPVLLIDPGFALLDKLENLGIQQATFPSHQFLFTSWKQCEENAFSQVHKHFESHHK